MRNISKLPSITAVEPCNTVSLDVPVGLTYDKIHFKYSGRQLTNSWCPTDWKLLKTH